ncbi:hypothetical protein VCHA57P527_60201 [Vibrio chagasii]|nr:hypothetical protein VCHA57P527_60201 [Vibrio chagasii]
MTHLWTPNDCMNCELFPSYCPYMGDELKSLLEITLKNYAPDKYTQIQQELPPNKKCEGDCEACTLPDWMKNC